MCQAVKCRTCEKTTWAGCGQHIQSVKNGVSASQWCAGKHTDAEVKAARENRGGFFARLFGR